MNRWVAKLEAANRRLIVRLRRAMRREYAIVAAEFEAGAWDIAKHRGRVVWLLKRHYRASFARFAKLGAAMLDGAEPQTRAEEKPKPEPVTPARVAAVLTAILATAIAEELLGAALERLLEDKSVVGAITAALESEATFAGAVAAAGRNPAVAASVAAAIIESGTTGGGSSPPLSPSPSEGGGERLTYRERVARFVEQHANQRGAMIAEGTRETITATIAQAAREGVFGERAVAARVAEALTGVRKATWRAARIARTEVGAAQNAALIAIAEDRGRPFTKTWVAIGDDRTRPTHAEASGQKIASDELFDVGGAQLAHPGDPNGPLKEIVNCRCTMLLETTE